MSQLLNIRQPLLFVSTLALSVVFSYIANISMFFGVAPALYLLNFISKHNYLHIITAMVLLAAGGSIVWGVLFANCLLIALLLVEGLLSARRSTRWSRIAAGILFLKIALFIHLPELTPYAAVITPHPLLDVCLILLALGLEAAAQVSHRRAVANNNNIANTTTATTANPRTDLLLVAFLTTLLLCYLLTTALLCNAIDFPSAILFTTIGFCCLLAIILFITSPFTSSLSSLTSIQHLFSLNVPVEEWVVKISALAEAHTQVRGFVHAIAEEFAQLPTIRGVTWQLDTQPPETIGNINNARAPIILNCPPLTLQLYRQRLTSPWEWVSYYLLARVAAEYCNAKRREEQHRARNLSHAMHETGARLTHDIKNILHSLTALTHTKNDDEIHKHLPALRERLARTLNKLQTAEQPDTELWLPSNEWWAAAQERYAHEDIRFDGSGAQSALLPATLFDLALDNFISNALVKRQAQPTLAITAELKTDIANTAAQDSTTAAANIVLSVCDDGHAIAADIAAQLFNLPVPSKTGFGVGLYQTKQEAAKHNFTPTLSHNKNGRVCFQLKANT